MNEGNRKETKIRKSQIVYINGDLKDCLGINKIKKEMEVHEVLMSNLMSNLGRRVKRKWWVFVCRV